VREVREMNMSWQSKNAIVEALQTEQNAAFACEWALPEFKFNEPGFLIAGRRAYGTVHLQVLRLAKLD